MEANPLGVQVSVECARPAEVRISYDGEGIGEYELAPKRVGVGLQAFDVLGLVADSTVRVRVDVVEAGTTWALGPLEVAIPPLPDTLTGCSAESLVEDPDWSEEEAICLPGGLDTTRGFVCFNRTGQPIWAVSHVESPDPKLLRPLMDGSLLLSGSSTNEVLVLDGAGRLLSTVSSLDFGRTRFSYALIDGHDVIQIAEGPWTGAIAFLAIAFDVLPNGRSYVGSGIVVLDPATRDVLWDWSLVGPVGDGAPIDATLDCGNIENCYYANAILHGVDEHGRQYFWIERNLEGQILRVDVDTDTVAWSLGAGGDFRLVDDLDAADPVDLPDALWMANPHSPEILSRSGSRTRFLVHDNGRAGAGGEDVGYSRVVEYEIDEARRLATIRFTYGGADAPREARWFSSAGGDADMLPGGDAFLLLTGQQGLFVSEVGYPDGRERWRLTCDNWGSAYRLAWFPTIYDTAWAYEGR